MFKGGICICVYVQKDILLSGGVKDKFLSTTGPYTQVQGGC